MNASTATEWESVLQQTTEICVPFPCVRSCQCKYCSSIIIQFAFSCVAPVGSYDLIKTIKYIACMAAACIIDYIFRIACTAICFELFDCFHHICAAATFPIDAESGPRAASEQHNICHFAHFHCNLCRDLCR